MVPFLKIVGWWMLFGGSHIAGSSRVVRSALVNKLGLKAFKALYCAVAYATFIPLCIAYAHARHLGPSLFEPTAGLQLAAQLLVLAGFIGLVQSQLTPNPMSTVAELSGRYRNQPTGVQRITRHPMNFSFGLIALGHVLANPFLTDAAFWSGFIVYGVLSAKHQDDRIRETGPEAAREFLAATSAVPFAAMLRGKQSLGLGEYHRGGLVAATVACAVVRAFHSSIFGGFGG
ncbi:MAG: hypothetical protein HYV63_24980 [Candidatus Schekmanbacteria bacterium]|nr:hypothetical protein [Candidatus Schekmanbacteria bacterium]